MYQNFKTSFLKTILTLMVLFFTVNLLYAQSSETPPRTLTDEGSTCQEINLLKENIITRLIIDVSPDIKANSSDGPVNVTPSDNVSLTISLDAGSSAGQNADWWIVQKTPGNQYFYYDIPTLSWKNGITASYQGPLINVASVNLPNITGLAEGSHTFYFCVDMVMNFILDLDQASLDTVVVASAVCYPDLPSPILKYTGSEDYIGSDQQEYTRYRFEVTNWSDYPDSLFAESPYLPPCGANPNASRTWTSLYDNNDNYLYGFCGHGSSENILKSLWFGLLKGTTPPECVYITLNDRHCDLNYTSNCTTLEEEVIEIYFADNGTLPGSAYHYHSATGNEAVIYTRPSGHLSSLCFSPFNQDQLYFVNATNGKDILVADLSLASETVVYTHPEYVRDITFNSAGELFFSEATGAGADGKIWRWNKDGTVSLFYTVGLSTVDGYWSGDFTFSDDDTLYLSSGNRVPASVYSVEVSSSIVTKVYTSSSEAIAGMVFGEDGLLYYANWGTKIYCLDLENGQRTTVYDSPSRILLSDVTFRVPGNATTDATGTWVMPYGIGGTRLDQIETTGLTNYIDSLSGHYMENAPFGARLGFRLGSASTIPTTGLKYYRFQYKRESESIWNDFVETVVVHYVKEKIGEAPKFPTYKLGPHDFSGINLYEFRPHEEDLPPGDPGETVSWPSTGFLGDIYSGFLNTEDLHLAPGRYTIKISVYDSTGTKVIPGAGTFKFVVPIDVASDGTILTDNPDPANIDDNSFVFTIRVDNRSCGAVIDEPTINIVGAGDCGFLYYNPLTPEEDAKVNISFHATHPDNFALFRFRIVRGPNTVGITSVNGYEVSALSAGVYAGDGSGNFEHNFLRTDLLGTSCIEAAFSENLYTYAKATTGWRHRINKFDASAVRAFALTPEEP